MELQESSDLLMTPFERNLEAELILCYADVTAQQFSHSLSDLRNDRYSPSNQSCLSRLFCRAFANPASKSLKSSTLASQRTKQTCLIDFQSISTLVFTALPLQKHTI